MKKLKSRVIAILSTLNFFVNVQACEDCLQPYYEKLNNCLVNDQKNSENIKEIVREKYLQNKQLLFDIKQNEDALITVTNQLNSIMETDEASKMTIYCLMKQNIFSKTFDPLITCSVLYNIEENCLPCKSNEHFYCSFTLPNQHIDYINKQNYNNYILNLTLQRKNIFDALTE